MAVAEKKLAVVKHEEFCLPRPNADSPRIEGFVAYQDAATGRSVPAAFVTRCLECGATTYERTGDG